MRNPGDRLPLTGRRPGNTVIPAVATISFKVSDEEARLIRARARSEGVSVSEHLRRRSRLAIPPPSPPKLVRCPHTGAVIFATLEDLPPLTTETVRELLADFP